VAHARMRQFNSVATNLWAKAADALGLGHARGSDGGGGGRGARAGGRAASAGAAAASSSSSSSAPLQLALALPPRAVNALRLASVWAFHMNLLRLQPPADDICSPREACVARLPVTRCV